MSNAEKLAAIRVANEACATAPPGHEDIKFLLRELDAALADAKSWKREWEMYANAWERELGSISFRKRHRIDALCEATRRQKEEWFALKDADRRRRLDAALASRDECEASIRLAAAAQG